MGFRVDFSEDSEPSEELGDRLGPEYVATPATRSEPDDIRVSNLPREFTDFVSQLALPDSEPPVNSPCDPVFSSIFDEIWVDETKEGALAGDNPPLSEPSFFKLTAGCKSALRISHDQRNTNIYQISKHKWHLKCRWELPFISSIGCW